MSITITKDEFTLAYLEHLVDRDASIFPKDIVKNSDDIWEKLRDRCDIDKLGGDDLEDVRQTCEPEFFDEVIEEIKKQPVATFDDVRTSVIQPSEVITTKKDQAPEIKHENSGSMLKSDGEEVSRVRGLKSTSDEFKNEVLKIVNREWQNGKHLTLGVLAAKLGYSHAGLINKKIDRTGFMRQLAKEIRTAEKSAERQGMQCGIRLNGTSDIKWENESIFHHDHKTIFEIFPEVAFMDYTKQPDRVTPDNYRLTFSRSEENHANCIEALKHGMNIAVVFSRLPETVTLGGRVLKVIDGDEHDWRYGDYDDYSERVCVGLRAKGTKAKSDTSGFVVAA